MAAFCLMVVNGDKRFYVFLQLRNVLFLAEVVEDDLCQYKENVRLLLAPVIKEKEEPVTIRKNELICANTTTAFFFFFCSYLNTLLDRDLVGADMDLGVNRGFIGGRDSSELLDLSSLSLLVQTLRITLLNNRQGCVRIHLHKRKSCLVVQLPGRITVRNVGANKGRNSNLRRVSKELRNLGNAANVLCPGLRPKSEILVQTEPDVVAVETVGGNLE